MSDPNPYAAPRPLDTALPTAVTQGGVWKRGDVLIMHKLAQLPFRCVKSNEPAAKKIECNFAWHYPAVYLTLLAGPIIYLLVALVFSKRAMVRIGLSDRWIAKRRRAFVTAWLLGLTGFAIVASAIFAIRAEVQIVVAGVIVIVVGILTGSIGSRMVHAKRIDDQFVWLAGVHRDYLATLPNWPN